MQFCAVLMLANQVVLKSNSVLMLNIRRYYHPAPPARAVVKAERTFEGISLDTPGQSGRQVSTMSRFQLCPACYEAEARRAPWRFIVWFRVS